MDTDTILGVCSAVAIALCGACILGHAWRQSKRPALKTSRSDPDLENILQDSLPTGRSSSATEDPTPVSSEVRYASPPAPEPIASSHMGLSL